MKIDYLKYSRGGTTWEIKELFIPKGRTAVWGPSGIGKSSFFDVLTGILPTNLQNNISVHYLLQDFGLIDFLTVEENICLSISSSKLTEAQKHLLAPLKINHLYSKNIWEISGGERARVAIGRCLICNYQMILMDEAFASLDPDLKEDSYNLFFNLTSRVDQTLFITHQVDEVLRFAEQVIFFKKAGNSISIHCSKPFKDIDLTDLSTILFTSSTSPGPFFGNNKVSFLNGQLVRNNSHFFNWFCEEKKK